MNEKPNLSIERAAIWLVNLFHGEEAAKKLATKYMEPKRIRLLGILFIVSSSIGIFGLLILFFLVIRGLPI